MHVGGSDAVLPIELAPLQVLRSGMDASRQKLIAFEEWLHTPPQTGQHDAEHGLDVAILAAWVVFEAMFALCSSFRVRQLLRRGDIIA
jgi:hypothetical protein